MLRQLNAVPGVLGTMICDRDGHLLAHALPPVVEEEAVARAAAALGERTAALGAALGEVATIDLRYTSSRIVVKTLGEARVLFLCAPTLNLQLLSMSAAGVLRQLERRDALSPPAPATVPAGGELHRLVQAVEELIRQRGGDRVRLRGQIALKAGFTLDLVDAGTPDDPGRISSLRAAARAVLGQDI